MELADLLDQLTGTFQQLFLPWTHLNRVDGVIVDDLLDRHGVTDRLHGNSVLKLRTVGAVLAQEWEHRFQARCPTSEVNDESFPEKPDQLSAFHKKLDISQRS